MRMNAPLSPARVRSASRSSGWMISKTPRSGAGGTAFSEENAERGLLARALELIRCEFTERTWQAFWRTAIEGRSAPEVAAGLSMSAGPVRVAKSRVLPRLREELGDLIE
jgi:DNA-directed RNA polymerase specialized sigma24 family protein